MVGPTPEDDRRPLITLLKVFFVVLIGVSAGLITQIGNATLLESGLVTLFGLVIGIILVWIVFPGTGETKRRKR